MIEIYGTTISLAEGQTSEEFREITFEDYDRILASEEAEDGSYTE